MTRLSLLAILFSSLCLAQTKSDYPTSDFPISFAPDAPGLVSAANLIPKPAGKDGSIISRDGHFYSGQNRIRFWGVNIAFGGNFPTHAEADKLAARLSNFGINAVRFHHMDMFPYPAGIFADQSLSKLSDEALDRLDYFIAALKKQGVYSNINLHVSRQYARPHKWENADKLENDDKIVDIFHPELIEANKQYATDLLTHVNKYTNTRYADEPARHKVLDLVGDLSLLGQDLCGHIVAYRSGHPLNVELVRVLSRELNGGALPALRKAA